MKHTVQTLYSVRGQDCGRDRFENRRIIENSPTHTYIDETLLFDHIDFKCCIGVLN